METMPTRLETVTDHLAQVRGLLAQLHQTLLEAERRDVERERGRMGSGEYLRLLLHDPRFAWLRPMGRMIARIDAETEEALAHGADLSDAAARGLVEEVRTVVTLRTGLEAGWRYADWLQRDPAVVMAHAALSAALRRRPVAWAA